MMMKKLAIASAIALMSMGAAQAQSTYTPTTTTTGGTVDAPTSTTTTTAETAGGLMSTLSTSLGNLFNAGSTSTFTEGANAIAGVPGVYVAYTGSGAQFGQPVYILDAVSGVQRLATEIEIETPPSPLLYQVTAPIAGVAARAAQTVYNALNPVDITALAGAVNLAAVNGGINISGVNVALTGINGNVTATATGLTSATALAINGNNLSTTVIGAMNSSTLDIMKKTENLSEMTKSTLNIDGLANQGAAPSITTQSFGPANLGLATTGSSILSAADASTQFNLTGLVSGTETLATSLTDSLQRMNVFNMAVNMAPLDAAVKITASLDPNAWFLNPQTGVVNLSGLQVATTAIGAMNSSVTRLGAKLSN